MQHAKFCNATFASGLINTVRNRPTPSKGDRMFTFQQVKYGVTENYFL